jgi:hypothetical protein
MRSPGARRGPVAGTARRNTQPTAGGRARPATGRPAIAGRQRPTAGRCCAGRWHAGRVLLPRPARRDRRGESGRGLCHRVPRQRGDPGLRQHRDGGPPERGNDTVAPYRAGVDVLWHLCRTVATLPNSTCRCCDRCWPAATSTPEGRLSEWCTPADAPGPPGRCMSHHRAVAAEANRQRPPRIRAVRAGHPATTARPALGADPVPNLGRWTLRRPARRLAVRRVDLRTGEHLVRRRTRRRFAGTAAGRG